MDATIRTGIVGDRANALLKIVEIRAVARPKSRKRDLGQTRETLRIWMDKRRTILENAVRVINLLDIVAHNLSVDLVLDLSKLARRDHAVLKERLDRLPTFRTEGLLHFPMTRVGSELDDVVRGMTRLERAREELTRKKMKVLRDGKKRGFRMKVIDVGHLMSAGDEPQRPILDELEAVD